MWNAIDGKKTYGLAILLGLLALCDIGGLVPEDNRLAVYGAVVAALAAAFRHAVSKLPADLTERIDRAAWLLQQIREFLPATNAHVAHQAAINRRQPDQDAASSSSSASSSVGIVALLCCLCLPSMAAADDLRVVGPSSVPAPGYPVDLFVQGTMPEGTLITWDHFPRREGLPLLEPKEDGRVARMNTMAGSYKLIVSIAIPGKKPVICYHDFFVPGSPYTPPVPPAPTPPTPPAPPVPQPVTPQPDPIPEPTFPAGEFGMAEATYRIVSQVPSANRKAEAACLAGKIAALINDLKTGKVASAQGVINAIATAFDGCLTPGWDTARVAFTDKVAAFHAAGQLGSLGRWQSLVNESLEGLNAAAR